jgi:hypothetical protein
VTDDRLFWHIHLLALLLLSARTVCSAPCYHVNIISHRILIILLYREILSTDRVEWRILLHWVSENIVNNRRLHYRTSKLRNKLTELRSSQQLRFKLWSSLLWHRVVWQFVTNISEERTASFLKMELTPYSLLGDYQECTASRMEAKCSSETFAPTYQTTWCHSHP